MVKNAIARVIEALGPEDGCKPSRWRNRRASVLDEDNIGAHLRHQREAAIGMYQGPLAVAAGVGPRCASGSAPCATTSITEILLRILRDRETLDARHLSLDDLGSAGRRQGRHDGRRSRCCSSSSPIRRSKMGTQ